jgi:hypothetical protein
MWALRELFMTTTTINVAPQSSAVKREIRAGGDRL